MKRLFLVTLSIIIPVAALCATGTVTLPPYVTNSRFGAHSSANQIALGGKLAVDRFTRYSSVHLSGGFGPQGEQGPQGERGFRGYSGATGAQGPQGLTGAQGPQGIQGEVGPQGLQGVAGAEGPIGPSNTSFQNHSSQTITAHGGIHSVPAGGTTGQKLIKIADTDYATGWSTDTDAYLPLTGGIIKPTTNTTTTLQVQKADATPVLNVDTINGRVGIGTATPAYSLDLTLVGQAQAQTWRTNGGYLSNLATYYNYNGPAVVSNQNTSANSAISLSTKNVEAIRIDPSQNVGIGTTTPATKGHIHIEDAGTTTTANLLTLSHNTTGTADVGLGVGISALAESTTTVDQALGTASWKWTNPTHATLASKFVVQTRDNGGALVDNLTLDGLGLLSVSRLSANSPTGFTGRLLQAQLNGVDRFYVTQAGAAYFLSSVTANGLLVTAGSAATPSIAVASNGTTGFFFNPAYIGQSIAGVEKARVDETGLTVVGTVKQNTTESVKSLDKYYAEMWVYDNTNAMTINTTNLYHALIYPAQGELSGWTFKAGKATSITAFANYGATVAGTVLVTAAGHTIATGDPITISGTTSYNGTFTATYVSVDTFYITDTWVANDATGTVRLPAYLKASAGSAGKYVAGFNVTGTGTGTNVDYKMEMNKNIAAQDNIVVERRFSSSTDYSTFAARGIVTVADGDIFWVSIKNKTNTTSITTTHVNVMLNRL